VGSNPTLSATNSSPHKEKRPSDLNPRYAINVHTLSKRAP
jgi:hypothetical protein